jgi:phosphatidylserine/phosphatidylglycerophosphate/cardiolipin synthase-like enzyme
MSAWPRMLPFPAPRRSCAALVAALFLAAASVSCAPRRSVGTSARVGTTQGAGATSGMGSAPDAGGATTSGTAASPGSAAKSGSGSAGDRTGPAALAVELVETFPVETSLDHPDVREAYQVWLEMIRSATRTLDIAEFYVNTEPGSRLEPIVQAVEDAAARAVRVRVLADAKFYKTYPQTLERLASRAGITVRRFDVGALTGGVLHAKYFLVDGREVYLGSQNFDWRSLEHIEEVGVRVRVPEVARTLQEVFDMDWVLAGGSRDRPHRLQPRGASGGTMVLEGQDTLRVRAVGSPHGWLPDEALWDLPQLVALIDSARSSVRAQLYSYKTVGHDHDYFDALEAALRRAAARGVAVQLLMADWCKRKGTIEGLQSLQSVPGIDVRLVTIPQHSGGFIPFARVTHAKYLTVDARRCWVGTDNWEKEYFYQSRNVGVIVEGASFAGQLDRFFDDNWRSSYAYEVDPCKVYEVPRIGE